MDRKQNIQIVVAMAKDRLMGSEGKLPWNRPEDLRLFRQLTLGHTVIMGRRTYESIGRPLDGRTNIVISSEKITAPGIETFPSFEEGSIRAASTGQKIFCIGGREIYRQALPRATHLHISWVDGDFEGDTFFPDLDLDLWQETGRSRHPGFTLVSYLRKQ